jgi:hypothetical protein
MTESMRALVIDEAGEGAMLRPADVQRPLRVQDDVLVRVIAAGVNPIDRKTKLGKGVAAAIPSFPAVLGLDFAGVVEEVPYAAHPVQPGDRVYGMGRVPRLPGSYAEYVSVSSLSVVPMPATIGFAEAARWLVHCHAFDASGIKSGAKGDDRVKGARGYPIGPGCCGRYGGVYASGENLRETLLLNLIATETEYVRFKDEDRPVWEREPQTAAIERRPGHDDEWPSGRPLGPLDLYTWQSRRVRFHFDEDGVTGALVCQGDKMHAANMQLVEPFTAWRRSPAQEKKLKQPVWPSVGGAAVGAREGGLCKRSPPL